MLKCLMGSLHWINKGKYKIDRDVATQWSSCKGIAFLAIKKLTNKMSEWMNEDSQWGERSYIMFCIY